MNTDNVLDLVRRYESRNVTFLDRENHWPIVWERAQGAYVWDAEGRRYLDLTAAFGVAAAGHANPRVVHAGQRQMARLAHAMGDVHPHALKARLARELSAITFERWHALTHKEVPRASTRSTNVSNTTPMPAHGKTIFCNSGFEAVEAALKTAALATGKRNVIAFQGAYHGLGYGTLNVTHREHFRSAFRSQLGEFGHFVEFPKLSVELVLVDVALDRLIMENQIGAVLVEPIQARGGINIPPTDFLSSLRQICDERGVLLILDEIYTGFGRTGYLFACERSHVVPDIICLGKALTGGFPLSACVGKAALMDKAWPASSGEAIHTRTYLGHPVGCAMALANIQEIRRKQLAKRSAQLGDFLLNELGLLQSKLLKLIPRGRGLMVGLEILLKNGEPATALCSKIVQRMLHAGFILLPEGEFGNVISFTPPLTIPKHELGRTVRALAQVLAKL